LNLNRDLEFICRIKPPECIVANVNNRFGPPVRAARQTGVLKVVCLSSGVEA